MGSLKSHKLQQGKTNTILKHRHLRMIASLLQYVEFCVVLVMVSRVSIQLLLAVKNSSEYFRGFSVFMAGPPFVFLVGNVIIITLIAQSAQFSANGSARDNPEHDIYQEFLQSSFANYKNSKTQADQTELPQKQSVGGTEDINKIQSICRGGVKYPEKISMKANNSIKGRRIDGCLVQYREKQCMMPSTETEDRIKDQKIDGDTIARTNMSLVAAKNYRRCQSEVSKHVQSEKHSSALHRCESENNMGSIEGAGPERVAAETPYPEDRMSNEEFRLTIEAFIARQQRRRRQEHC